jgi:dTDP-4-dehydrorhamnose reductase
MFKILVTGSNGQVGSELVRLSTAYKQYEFTFIHRKHLELSSPEAIKNFFDDKTFDAIINCAAYTSVDKAQSESDLADKINHKAVANLAQIAKDKNISLIHISTDYIFDGESCRPYIEADSANPLNVYGKTKLAGEEAILSIAPAKTIIIRTSWVYSSFGLNFVKTMLRLGQERDSLGIVFDQIGTPTYARDLARTILDILPRIENPTPVIYHYSNEGVASWYDFAKAIIDISHIQCNVRPITTAEYPTPATRPHNSLMNKNKIKNYFGITIPYWKDSLIECLDLMRAKE